MVVKFCRHYINGLSDDGVRVIYEVQRYCNMYRIRQQDTSKIIKNLYLLRGRQLWRQKHAKTPHEYWTSCRTSYRLLSKSNSYSNKEWKDLFLFTNRNRIDSLILRFKLFL
jgi:hypothetical protein